MSIKGYFTEGPIWGLITRWTLVVLLLVSFLFALNEDYSNKLKALINNNNRVILSTVNGDLLNSGEQFKIVKVKDENKIFIEIYSTPVDGVRQLFDRISLPDPRDGYFLFGKAVTNLALKDLDNDQKLEIIAPSFDANLNGHLNIYQFNMHSNRFEEYLGTISY